MQIMDFLSGINFSQGPKIFWPALNPYGFEILREVESNILRNSYMPWYEFNGKIGPFNAYAESRAVTVSDFIEHMEANKDDSKNHFLIEKIQKILSIQRELKSGKLQEIHAPVFRMPNNTYLLLDRNHSICSHILNLEENKNPIYPENVKVHYLVLGEPKSHYICEDLKKHL